MRTTKHIKKLAFAMAKEDIKNSNFWTDKDINKLTEWNAKNTNKNKKCFIKW
tara:strand:+ start:6392 stop:6547 length:156 start_codon:yes stop_codon:yes gene_type:complete